MATCWVCEEKDANGMRQSILATYWYPTCDTCYHEKAEPLAFAEDLVKEGKLDPKDVKLQSIMTFHDFMYMSLERAFGLAALGDE